MLASRITMRRTTVTADEAALATLAAEARRRGVSLSAVLAEAVADKAAAIRAARRPRVGLGRSRDGRSAADVTAEPIAEPPS
jgi:Ribbon-helix-helix protein, copG family